MNWADWEMTWSGKHYQWFNNREEYIRGGNFNDNLIGIYKFLSTRKKCLTPQKPIGTNI